MISADGVWALCMRVPSDKPSTRGMGGWLHKVGETARLQYLKPQAPKPVINATAIIRELLNKTKTEWIASLAGRLGVAVPALVALNCAWASEHNAWAFPMRDGYGNAVGIRLRSDEGRKWAITGSRQGIFLPESEPQGVMVICEGPTDTAAAIGLGLFAVGRASCNCGAEEIRTVCKRLGVTRAVIATDNDSPGVEGAKKLVNDLKMDTCLFIPPAKDFRDFVRLGGTRELFCSMTSQMLWNNSKPITP